MWEGFDDICEITSITNAQNKTYWMDEQLAGYLNEGNDTALVERKKALKKELFRRWQTKRVKSLMRMLLLLFGPDDLLLTNVLIY
ncbi:MAG: hypothetical protein U5K54_21100 [Cytophagales bacterium]|nr:hypothetical protein [Cytophagales bacterium]